VLQCLSHVLVTFSARTTTLSSLMISRSFLALCLCSALEAPSAMAQWFGTPSPSGTDTNSTFDRIEAAKKDSQTRQRAVNIARAKAISLNGGLANYRPENCMFSSQAEGCLIRIDSSGFIFRFKGGAPGWQQYGWSPSYVTEIRVSADGREVTDVIENSRY